MIANPYHEKTLSKIIKSPEALRNLLAHEHPDSKIALVKGVYDLLHSGHYLSFVNAKMHGDILVVAVNSDAAVQKRKGPERPVISQDERMLIVAALECVDWVTLYDEESPYHLLSELKPHVFAASHFESLTTEQLAELKTQTCFQIVPKLGGNSTTRIIQRITEGSKSHAEDQHSSSVG